MINYIKKSMRYNFHLITFLLLIIMTSGCGGGGGGETSWDFIDMLVPSIGHFKSTPVWETWEMSVLLVGDDVNLNSCLRADTGLFLSPEKGFMSMRIPK